MHKGQVVQLTIQAASDETVIRLLQYDYHLRSLESKLAETGLDASEALDREDLIEIILDAMGIPGEKHHWDRGGWPDYPVDMIIHGTVDECKAFIRRVREEYNEIRSNSPDE